MASVGVTYGYVGVHGKVVAVDKETVEDES
jgi:hypothetical protein